MSADKLVLVTGASGFLGSHVIQQLLQADYPVRAVVRRPKLAQMQEAYASYGNKVQVVAVDDIAHSDLRPVLRGVTSVIHVASPLPAKGSAREILRGAIEGTLNVLRQGYTCGIKKFVVTGSSGSVVGPYEDLLFTGTKITPSDWSDIKFKEVINGPQDPMFIYGAAKTLAEQSAWNFAEQHSDLDLTTIIPPRLHGPFTREQPITSTSDLSTNVMVLALISGPIGRSLPPVPPRPLFCDVRDVAKAHVRALECPPKRYRKRILLCAGHFTQTQAVEHLSKSRHASSIQKLLPEAGKPKPLPGPVCTFDMELSRKLLGMKEEDLISWQDSLDDTVESLLDLKRRVKLSDTPWGDLFLGTQKNSASGDLSTNPALWSTKRPPPKLSVKREDEPPNLSSWSMVNSI
ncbi:NAD(P)-binding protein [Sistotremastrum suecicum HHB10207 ss-3]|uniref:NAD(P)-binding protein n=1 Tax=Sistotremastrum suecicum HHB10207 ss-3 TaxID=1314776 RepID=A0A166G9A9_9AGAM|nr:NAD(P)-binding protein [Sistotremastrum suecicum HHB10207 ss-3]